ncbi:hypothetical protein FV226_13170 [Methylobacterium sp. WL12]|uniref:hypothetical protein n=1 Tax=Methylobacterium sp. WL12 TaxID=2603890 RepID=UPI0011C9568F|nr:hypothetical protein [Methylobacterium sp. WL12]TXM72174.1 hypothetical protein FV226_13170 [Methylobacterium sp. WL12]
MSATGQAIRDLYALRVEVARQDERLNDRGSRLEGVLSCEAIVSDAASAMDLLSKRVVVAEQERTEAVTELKSARFRHEQSTRCAGCGERKHTPLRVGDMGGYVCLTCIDKRLTELLSKEGQSA